MKMTNADMVIDSILNYTMHPQYEWYANIRAKVVRVISKKLEICHDNNIDCVAVVKGLYVRNQKLGTMIVEAIAMSTRDLSNAAYAMDKMMVLA